MAFVFSGKILFGQSSLVLSSDDAVPGGTASLTLTLNSSPGNQPTALQWTVNYRTGSIKFINMAAGPMLKSSSKSLSCNDTGGAYTCIAWGLNSGAIPDGVVATVSMILSPTASGSVAFTMNDALGVSPAGSAISISLTNSVVNVLAYLSVSFSTVTLSANVGSPSSASFVDGLFIGGEPTSFSTSARSTGNWLSVTPGGGSSSGKTVPLTILANPTGLVAGPYTGTILITSGGVEETINVTFNVTEFSSVVATGALPQFAAGGTWTTGILVLNTGSQPAKFSIAFFDDNGQAVTVPFVGGASNNLSGTIPAQGSGYFEAADSQGATVVGWGQITADPSIVVQALFRNDVAGTYYEAAVPSSAGSKEFLIPFDATTFAATGAPFFTGFAIANLDPTAPAITCTARDANGNVIPDGVPVPQLSGLGHWSNYLFPALTGQRGTIDCVSTTNIAAAALRFIGNNAFSSLPVINKQLPAPGSSMALPQFAAGGTWTTGILVLNTGSQPAKFSIAFFDDNGQAVTVPFVGGASNNLSGTIPAQGSGYFEAADSQGATVVGWGQITADPSIVVQALFRNDVAGTYYEAAVPSSAGSKEFLIPFDATTFAATGAPFFTGFAIANLDPTAPTITCTARDANGNVIPDGVPVPELSGLGHWSNYLFPALTGQRGTIDCVSTTNIAAAALRFIGNNAFSSLPVTTK